MEVIPLSDIYNIKTVDRSWYMKGDLNYFEVN